MPVSLASAALGNDRLRVRVRGAVQGVGFRPFVHGLAARHGLSGFVLNDQDGVLAEIEGADVGGFLSALRRETPALARIDAVEATPVPPGGEPGFFIRESTNKGTNGARGVPDAATCPSCLNDLFDPESRFYHYPFVTCTNCGPRFTITARLPFDRQNTAMQAFPLCRLCAADYGDPSSRRFHAETIACPACGPRLSHPLDAIAAALRQEQIVALKGLGGFQLLCDATNEAAVARLRDRKHRPAKPFAVMVANVASLNALAEPTQAEIELLQVCARPIVLVREGFGLAPSVAPGLDQVGIMLPSTPAHHLLFHTLDTQGGIARGDTPTHRALIVTSANLPGEPLVIDNASAIRDLASIADMVVTHDRAILERADDSVMRMIDGAPAFIRRSRGFAPEPIDLGADGPAVMGVGAHLKATICVTRGREAFLSQHVGDLDSAQTVRFYQETAEKMLATLGVTPELVACDRHPDYRSTLFAETSGLPVLRVQHHAAHLAAVAAECHLHGRMIGVALDGYGHGDDGGAWGGELMIGGDGDWSRVGQLRPLPLPGGDRAAREPWRMGVAALVALGRGAEAAERFPRQALAEPLAISLSTGQPSPATTSLGRLFDTAAALLGICERQSYEGQAASELEALCGVPRGIQTGFTLDAGRLDFSPLLRGLLEPGLTAREGSTLFHGTLIEGLTEWIVQAAMPAGGRDVVLGGGCLVNRVLANGLAEALRSRGLRPWLPRSLPANDGGIALGQAAIARAHLSAEAGPQAIKELTQCA
jgi:hydrogenase maturation protein HypF